MEECCQQRIVVTALKYIWYLFTQHNFILGTTFSPSFISCDAVEQRRSMFVQKTPQQNKDIIPASLSTGPKKIKSSQGTLENSFQHTK
jgi:hypothetical protein